ncbi:hypothetical protein MPTK1_2g20980 [Marchantia polymorpha subsp. ruderalis]|nr:hypothetical protein MARPO_0040s0114 [Marchantia polymorpha]BBN03130.1 hypothetical protein Mp_2g20980 [Marchantia polymorpha subsp. ruderalis]|eukprot:PTQ40444.1 hypothetical protein MARPO_0040s0114 [Marchantia polymorpha]
MMARPRTLTALLSTIFVAILQVSVDAATWMVGDDLGSWTVPATSNDLNYTAWAEARNIRFADQLFFNYSNRTHSVLLVNSSSFDTCLFIDPIETFRSGHDNITLAMLGVRDYYFICGEPSMCFLEQKLHVSLVGDVPSAPPSLLAPPPPSLHSGALSILHVARSMASSVMATSIAVFVMTR